MKGIEEGIFDDISNFEYHHGKYRKCLGSSGLKQLEKSAAHFKAWQDSQVEDTTTKDAFVFGGAYHRYILERPTFDSHYFIAPKIDRRTKEGKAAAARIEEESKGKTVILESQLEDIKKMDQAMTLNRSATAILKNPGKFERTYIWKDPDYNIWCKCRTDLVIENIKVIVDLKSTTNAAPFGFPKSAANYGYDISAAHYTKGVNYLTGDFYTWLFLAQEKDPPYAPCVFSLDHDVIMQASQKIDPLMQRLGKALRTGVWDGYPDEVIPLQMPAWYK